jgi:AcrR family transcriptional regulator
VAAAARCFAAAGYDATSVRQVAADAGVDPALVRRFFGGKEQLFTEVAAALIDPAGALAAVADGPPEAVGERLLRYFLTSLGDVQQPGPFLGLIRSAVTSEHAASLMRGFLAERVLGEIAATLRADRPELRAALVASQLVGLAVARYAVGLAPLTAADPDELARWVAPVVQHYLTGSQIS